MNSSKTDQRRAWSRFFRQCRAVAEMYVRRPSNWGILLFGGALLVVISGGYFNFFRGQQPRQLAMIPRPFYSFDYLQGTEVNDFSLFLKRRPAESVRSLMLTANAVLSFDDLPRLPPGLGQLVNLNALRLDGIVSGLENADLREIARLRVSDVTPLNSARNLTHLELRNCVFTAGTLAFIGQHHPVTTLVIDSMGLDGGSAKLRLDELLDFPRVRHLELNGVPFTPELIDILLQLPSLQILTVRNMPQSSLELNELSKLKQHPGLTWVFADWGPYSLQDEIVREALNPVRALPVQVPRQSTQMLIVTQGTVLLLTVLLIVNMQVQFMTPGALLVPGFTWPHLSVPTLLTILTLLLNALLISSSRGMHLLPVYAVNAAFPSLCAMTFLGSLLLPASMSPALAVLVIAIGGQMAIMAPMVAIDVVAARMHWFLLGEQTALAAGITALELTACTLAVWKFTRLHCLMSESSATLPKANFSWTPQDFTRSPMPAMCSWGVTQPRGLTWHAHDPHRRREHLQAGMNIHPHRFLLISLPFAAAAILIMSFFGLTTEVWLPFMAAYVPIIGGMAPIMSLQGWSMRLPMLGEESLRPVTRQDFARDLILTYLRSCWPVLLPVPLLVGVEIWQGISLLIMLTHLLVVAGVIGSCLSCGLFLFAYPKRWWTGVMCFVPVVIQMQFLMIGLMFLANESTHDLTLNPAGLAALGAFLLAISILVTGFLHRRIVNREWGLD